MRPHLPRSSRRGLAIVAREIGAQSQMIAMLDAFKLITLSYLFRAPMVLLLRKAERSAPPPTASTE